MKNNSLIRDINLAPFGRQKIDWALSNMPLLTQLNKEFAESKPFKGLNIALSIHLEAKTACLVNTLAIGGANMFVTGSNPLSTQDDIAAALVEQGISVFAWHDATEEEYNSHIEMVINSRPNIIIDDGGDLVNFVNEKRPDLIPEIIGGCEETTTGILRLKSLEKKGDVKFPMVSVNDAKCKFLFDNRYGTGQSVWNAINKTTNLIVAGKNVVVAGYGWCGKGVALRAKGQGAKIIICEVDPIKAIEAVMDGFHVMTMEEAAKIGDYFVTVTGCNNVIDKRHFSRMKDGAIICNAGHFNVEININDLESEATEVVERRNNIKGYHMNNGNWINLLAEGRLVNLAAGDGHPVEIMDMSFAIQALSAKYLADNRDNLKDIVSESGYVIKVPNQVDLKVANLKLKSLGITIDELTEEQFKYLYG